VVPPDRIHGLEVDVFCPCALGGVINDRTVPDLRCKVIAGCANNQLATLEHGDYLRERGILYAPDYIINAGGTIFDTDRLLPGGFNEQRAWQHVDRIFETTTQVLQSSTEEGISTARAADRLAEQRLAGARQVQNVRRDVRIVL
jgi:leucine dehydrogenase